MRIDWDAGKAERNLAKHGVSFQEAATALMDPNALSEADEEHSDDEDRRRIIGMSFVFRVLTVITVEREEEDVIRIVTARKANRYEQSQYEEAYRRNSRGG